MKFSETTLPGANTITNRSNTNMLNIHQYTYIYDKNRFFRCQWSRGEWILYNVGEAVCPGIIQIKLMTEGLDKRLLSLDVGEYRIVRVVKNVDSLFL